MIINIKKYL